MSDSNIVKPCGSNCFNGWITILHRISNDKFEIKSDALTLHAMHGSGKPLHDFQEHFVRAFCRGSACSWQPASWCGNQLHPSPAKQHTVELRTADGRYDTTLSSDCRAQDDNLQRKSRRTLKQFSCSGDFHSIFPTFVSCSSNISATNLAAVLIVVITCLVLPFLRTVLKRLIFGNYESQGRNEMLT